MTTHFPHMSPSPSQQLCLRGSILFYDDKYLRDIYIWLLKGDMTVNSVKKHGLGIMKYTSSGNKVTMWGGVAQSLGAVAETVKDRYWERWEGRGTRGEREREERESGGSRGHSRQYSRCAPWWDQLIKQIFLSGHSASGKIEKATWKWMKAQKEKRESPCGGKCCTVPWGEAGCLARMCVHCQKGHTSTLEA